jgi:hypothetical protein
MADPFPTHAPAIPEPLRSQASLVPRSPRLLRAARLSCCLSSLTWGEDRTEPYAVVAGTRAAEAAVRRPAVERVEAPTAAPKHAVIAR